MSRYIDTDEIKRQWDIYGSLDIMDRILADVFPTVDAVPVVRCEDCIHSRPDEYGLECMVHYRPTKEEDFCSYGEKVTE